MSGPAPAILALGFFGGVLKFLGTVAAVVLVILLFWLVWQFLVLFFSGRL